MRACVIFNPTARGEKAARLRQQLDAIASQCALRMTARAGDARLLATEAVNGGFDTVVAAGGDGTINEVVNGIVDANGLDQVRLGVLPVGTVNVFARETGVPLNLSAAWQTILAGREMRIDLPTFELAGSSNEVVHRCFVQMAGVGWDARAIQLADWNLKKRIGQFAYVLAGVRALRTAHPRIQVTRGSADHAGQFVILGNGRFYAGSFSVFHRAHLQDGLLDVCIFPRLNWFVLVRYLWGFISRSPAHLRREIYFQTPELTLASTHPLPIQVDGEFTGHLPARCVIRPLALRILIPKTKNSEPRTKN